MGKSIIIREISLARHLLFVRDNRQIMLYGKSTPIALDIPLGISVLSMFPENISCPTPMA